MHVALNLDRFVGSNVRVQVFASNDLIPVGPVRSKTKIVRGMRFKSLLNYAITFDLPVFRDTADYRWVMPHRRIYRDRGRISIM